MADDSAFISYRRETGFSWARLVWDGLRDRDIDAFLDLESMRAAGRFDERLLNQVAARPYFVVILTAETLDRCEAPSDWMRREIEHAILHERIIVPVFVAPFAPSHFPPTLPPQIAQSLSRSNGLTLYSQYLSAGLDKLANELLVPVGLRSAPLSPADARFQEKAEQEMRATPLPEVESTPKPVPHIVVADAPPAEVAAETSTPPIHVEPVEALVAIEPVEPIEATKPVEPVESVSNTNSAGPPDAPVSDAPSDVTPAAPDDGRRRRMVAAAAITAVVAFVFVGIVVLLATRSTGDEASPESTVASASSVSETTDSGTVDDPETGDDDVPTGLRAGSWLAPGDQIASDDGTHVLEMTLTGRVVLRVDDRVVWEAPATNSKYPQAGSALALQGPDANLVLYEGVTDDGGSIGQPIWASGATVPIGEPNAELVIDANRGAESLVVLVDGRELWRSSSPTSRGEGGQATETTKTTTVTTDATNTTTSVTTTATTLPAESGLTLAEVVSDFGPTVTFRFVNEGKEEVSVERVDLHVAGRSEGSPLIGQAEDWKYDVSVDLTTGTVCSVDGDDLGWASFVPAGRTTSRRITFGHSASDAVSEVKVTLAFTIWVDDATDPLPITEQITLIAPAAKRGPTAPATC